METLTEERIQQEEYISHEEVMRLSAEIIEKYKEAFIALANA